MLVSSSGGHFSELEQIERREEYNYIVITEKSNDTINKKVDYYIKYGTRKNIIKYSFIFLYNALKSLIYIVKEKPDVIISTGAHSCVSFFYFAKLFKIKTIYIESYAKVYTPSLTYKLIKKVSSEIIIQHKELKEKYEPSKFFGGIY